MKYLPSFQHLLHIAQRVLSFDNTSEWILSQYFKQHKNLGKQDRHFISQSIYTLLRNREKILGFLYKQQDYSVENEVKIATNIAFPNTAPLQDSQLFQDFLAYTVSSNLLNEQAELPIWIIKLLATKLTDNEIIALGKSLKNIAPLDIRTNIVKIKRSQLIDKLQKDNITGKLTTHSPWGIRIEGHPYLMKHPLYEQGLFEIQDEGSQLIAYLLQAKKNQLVIDFCAGAGGKTLAIGNMLNNQGSIYAFEVEASRLNQIKPRLQKSGLKNVYPILIQNEHDEKIKKFTAKADIVLVDAPCSGLGTIRRQPDLKYRNNPPLLTNIQKKQWSILCEASKLCRNNGKLIYATCSILPQENELLIQSFLETHQDYDLIGCQKLLSGITITKPILGMEFNPITTQTDGFYIAIMQKI